MMALRKQGQKRKEETLSKWKSRFSHFIATETSQFFQVNDGINNEILPNQKNDINFGNQSIFLI